MQSHSSLRFAQFSHRGCHRKTNEDATLCSPDLGLFVIADGLGGHEGGQVASQCVIRQIQISLKELGRCDYPLQAIEAAIDLANTQIRRHATLAKCIMGSTLVLLWLEGERYHLFWSGDSRCYLFRNERLTALTQDHRLPGHTNQLTQALGARQTIFPDYQTGFLYERDVFLLCSDGVTDCLHHQALEQRLRQGTGHTVKQTCQALLEDALLMNAADNISMIILDIGQGQS